MRGLGAPLDSSLAAEGGVEDGGDKRCDILHKLEAVGNMGQLVGGRTTLHKRRPRAVYRGCSFYLVSLVQRNQRNQKAQINQTPATRHEMNVGLQDLTLFRCLAIKPERFDGTRSIPQVHGRNVMGRSSGLVPCSRSQACSLNLSL